MLLPDGPRTLSDRDEREFRRESLQALHMQPLTALVETIRSETGRTENVPNFDPADGGIYARCLFLLEAPGRNAVRSGFVSRNNPDGTAKNFFELSREADIPREQTLIWNIVPWYIGSGTKIRAATQMDLAEASPYVLRLLGKLSKLEVVVLVGKKAAKAQGVISQYSRSIKLVTMPHPSPLFVNHNPTNRDQLLGVLNEIAQLLNSKTLS